MFVTNSLLSPLKTNGRRFQFGHFGEDMEMKFCQRIKNGPLIQFEVLLQRRVGAGRRRSNLLPTHMWTRVRVNTGRCMFLFDIEGGVQQKPYVLLLGAKTHNRQYEVYFRFCQTLEGLGLFIIYIWWWSVLIEIVVDAALQFFIQLNMLLVLFFSPNTAIRLVRLSQIPPKASC